MWQINDCWPVTSWSMCDYYLRPKHAYYTVKREMAPLSVGITRRLHLHPRDKYTRARVDVSTRIEIWASNLTLDDLAGVDCVVKAWDVETGELTHSATAAARLAAAEPLNRACRHGRARPLARRRGPHRRGRLPGGRQRHDAGPLRQLARAPSSTCTCRSPRGSRPTWSPPPPPTGPIAAVEVSAEVPVKGLALECDDDAVRFDDNLVDIVPGEVCASASAAPRRTPRITTRYLGMLN